MWQKSSATSTSARDVEYQLYIFVASIVLLIGGVFGKLRSDVEAIKQRLDSDARFTAKGFDGIERRISEDRRRVDELTKLDFRK